ncbi:MAG: autoinducer binding domain-containing protein [Alphaproteobacteria bacterium]|nr:autoinducer binding domain-containing protein [Alphaproteobacteria bacterium]
MIDLNDFLLNLSNKFGFDHITCWNINDEKKTVSTYPLEWKKKYLEFNFKELDYAMINQFRKPYPFIWGNLSKNNLSENEKKVFLEAKNFDINSGYSIPIKNENGLKTIINFASKEKQKYIENKILHMYDKFFIANLVDTLIEHKENKNTFSIIIQKIDEIFFYNKKIIKKNEDRLKKIINIINNKMLISKHKNIENSHEQSILDLIEIKNFIIQNM